MMWAAVNKITATIAAFEALYAPVLGSVAEPPLAMPAVTVGESRR